MDNLFIQKEFKIIHIDMDYFYAQVEMRDNPALRGVPVAIGGPSRTQGILCTSNYEARQYGVRAAVSTSRAFQLCPDLILIPPCFSKYKEISNEINEIFLSFSDKVQAVSLDEAYIDVTDCKVFHGSATVIAQEIKKGIFKRTGLTASAGVSFNKMLAKIASDWNKPDGIFVITPDMRESFMRDLPLSKIPGIGSVKYEKLKKMGFKTCGDITDSTLIELFSLFGKRNALYLYEACQGISNASVASKSKRKSFGLERTFFDAIDGEENIRTEIEILLDKYNIRLKELDQFHVNSREISHISIKIRFSDFKTYTREIPVEANHSAILMKSLCLDEDACQKIRALFYSMNQTYKQPVRLIGVGIKLRDRSHEQLGFGWCI